MIFILKNNSAAFCKSSLAHLILSSLPKKFLNVSPIIQNWNHILLELKEWQEFGVAITKGGKELINAY